jgi:hypothetical protein
MGRKPLALVAKHNVLQIRLTLVERALFDNAADVTGEATSEWARRVLLGVATREGPKPPVKRVKRQGKA